MRCPMFPERKLDADQVRAQVTALSATPWPGWFVATITAMFVILPIALGGALAEPGRDREAYRAHHAALRAIVGHDPGVSAWKAAGTRRDDTDGKEMNTA